MGTDSDWQAWGERDPYYGVLAAPRFRRAVLDEQTRQEFFALGQVHVDQVLRVCRERLLADFAPQRVLDFGCGVGRLLLPFAAAVGPAGEVVGLDVSPAMLAEARRNCDAAGLTQVRLLHSDDHLSALPSDGTGTFDLVHSAIVLQHIPVERGLRLFERLLRCVRPGGIGAIQVAAGWDHWDEHRGVPPPVAPAVNRRWWRRTAQPVPASTAPRPDPEMQMHFYNLSQLTYALCKAGVSEVHTELAAPDGVLTAFLFFRR